MFCCSTLLFASEVLKHNSFPSLFPLPLSKTCFQLSTALFKSSFACSNLNEICSVTQSTRSAMRSSWLGLSFWNGIPAGTSVGVTVEQGFASGS